jgi:hypothetical protein
MKSRVEVLLPNKDNEYVIPAEPNKIRDFPVCLVVLVESGRLRHFQITNQAGAVKILHEAQTKGIYILSRKINITFYPCLDIESARNLKKFLQDEEMFYAPTRMQTLFENAYLTFS